MAAPTTVRHTAESRVAGPAMQRGDKCTRTVRELPQHAGGMAREQICTRDDGERGGRARPVLLAVWRVSRARWRGDVNVADWRVSQARWLGDVNMEPYPLLHIANSNLPMLCKGDLNDIMHSYEKLGPSSVDVNRMNAFYSYVKHCGLIDLGFNGPAYTWSNKRFSSAPTYERLDRCLANAEWCRLFPTSSVLHLPMMYNDHAPILLLPTSNRLRPKKPF
jgi:hypothetical protein